MDVVYIRLGSQLLAAIISFFFLLKYKNNFLQLLTLFLCISAFVESVGLYYITKGGRSSFLYHYIYTLLGFLIISLMYYKLIHNKNKRIFFSVFSILYLLFWIVVYYKLNLFSYLIILYAIIISFYIFLYLRELLLSNKILNYKQSLPFWISAGFLVFYLSSVPFFSLYEFMANRGLFFILDVLIILMNLIIIYGLLCSKKVVKY